VWLHERMSKLNSSAFPIIVFSELYSWIHVNYFTAWLPI
jgi:hypothetical protein